MAIWGFDHGGARIGTVIADVGGHFLAWGRHDQLLQAWHVTYFCSWYCTVVLISDPQSHQVWMGTTRGCFWMGYGMLLPKSCRILMEPS